LTIILTLLTVDHTQKTWATFVMPPNSFLMMIISSYFT